MYEHPGKSAKFEYPEDWDVIVHEQFLRLRKERYDDDVIGYNGLCWFLTDLETGDVLNYKLIWSKNGPCWQNREQRNNFVGAFVNERLMASKGYKEVAMNCEVVYSVCVNGDGQPFVKIQKMGD